MRCCRRVFEALVVMIMAAAVVVRAEYKDMGNGVFAKGDWHHYSCKLPDGRYLHAKTGGTPNQRLSTDKSNFDAAREAHPIELALTWGYTDCIDKINKVHVQEIGGVVACSCGCCVLILIACCVGCCMCCNKKPANQPVTVVNTPAPVYAATPPPTPPGQYAQPGGQYAQYPPQYPQNYGATGPAGQYRTY